MSYFLSSLPLWITVLLLVVIPTALAMGAQAFIHRWVGVERLVQNNDIAGFKFATVGVIYAVLLGFTVIAVWEKFNAAENAVEQEAGSIAALLRYAEGKDAEAVALRGALKNYASSAINNEWPAMAGESESRATGQALGGVYDAALALGRTGTRETADMAEVFTQIDNVTAARRVQDPSGDGTRSQRRLGRAVRRRAPDRRLHPVLRQRESFGASHDDRRIVRAGHPRSGGDHFHRSPLHRPSASSAGAHRQRNGGNPVAAKERPLSALRRRALRSLSSRR